MDKLLDGISIVVTGGSGGIGKAIIEKCASEGARIALQYNKGKKEAEKLQMGFKGSVFLFQADFSNMNEVPGFFNQVISELNHVDVLINNAGIAIHSDLKDNDLKWLSDWNQTMNVNLNSAAVLCRMAILYFIEKNIPGRIINISSRAAFRGDTEDYLAYAASKGGIVSLTRSIARAFGKNGIVAFNIAPGFVKTPMAQQFFDQYGLDQSLKDNALNSLTTPEDLAPLIAFLASGQADHATGATFDFNAGSYVH